MNSQQLLAPLVSFDTTSALSNLALIDWVEDYLSEYGIAATRVYDDAAQKANLYATIGPQDKPGILLSGHTDVVPVKGQHWHSDPFMLIERDERLYGRGSCDMKGFIACVLALVPRLAKASLRRPVHLALSYDEEVGCLGVRHLIGMMQDLPVCPAMAIIGEPTSMELVVAHKGKQAVRAVVEGHSCHSAYPTEGINAVEYAAELIAEIRRIHAHYQTYGPFDHDYQVPHTTLHVGRIQGGTALNIVPKQCQFDFEIRHLPNDEPEDILKRITHYAQQTLRPQMQAYGKTAQIHFERLSGYPGLFTAPDAHVVDFVRGLLKADSTLGKVSFGTEGGLFSQHLSIPAVVCGPGSIQQAHQPDEYISLQQLRQCDEMLERLLGVLTA